jgi:glycosyltransferase involved in cell wall biosynthesis
MRVCLLSCFPYPGTSSTAYYGYSQAMARHGVDMTVLAAYDASPRVRAVRRFDDQRVKVYELPITTYAKKSLAPTQFAVRAFSFLNRLQDEHPFDVLQMQAFPNLGLGLHPIRNQAQATVLDIRTSAISGPFLNLLSKLMLRFQARLFRHVVVLDEHLANSLFASRRQTVTIIPLGADFRMFHAGDAPALREELEFTADDLVSVYAGSMDTVRTVHKLVRAFADVAETRSEAKLVLIGAGDQTSYLQSLVNKRGLADRVRFVGLIPYTQVPQYLQAADIGLAYVADRAQYRNQPPLKTVEYLASGLPVVATDTPGNRRFVEHRRNGLLVQDSVQALASGIACLMKDQALRLDMGRIARKSVDRFSYDHIVKEQLLPFYERCLAESAW